MSFSGHKIYGPKGIGALYVRAQPKVHLTPLFYGGNQQWGVRPGTEAPGLISAFAKAVQFCVENQRQHTQHVKTLRDLFYKRLHALPGIRFNTDPQRAIPHILNVCFEDIDGEVFLLGTQNEIAISQGSACASGTTQASHVLRAIGLKHQEADRSFRFSFSHLTSIQDLEATLAAIDHLINPTSRKRS